MRSRSKTVAGSVLVLAGLLVAANAVVSGPHAFEFGWSAVAGLVASGLVLSLAGISLWRESRRPP